MKGVNRVTLLGRSGKKPVLGSLPSGDAVVNLSIATNRIGKDKKTEYTEWHKVVFFGHCAEIIARYYRKGEIIYIEGHLRTTKWTDKHDNDHYSTKIHVDYMEMLGGNDKDCVGKSTQTDNLFYGDKDDDIPF